MTVFHCGVQVVDFLFWIILLGFAVRRATGGSLLFRDAKLYNDFCNLR